MSYCFCNSCTLKYQLDLKNLPTVSVIERKVINEQDGFCETTLLNYYQQTTQLRGAVERVPNGLVLLYHTKS